jgi:thiosulfate/3-mercaptopyruvate sulfurtransferase
MVVALAAAVAVASGVAATGRLLLDPATLHAQRDARDLRVIDVSDDVADYRKGHVPGAIHVDLDTTRTPVPAGGFRLPNADEASRLFGRLGLTPGSRVVLYDDGGSLNAAWLFYVLEAYGHRSAAILDGGMAAWRRAKLPIATDTPAVAPTTYRVTLRPERVVTAEWIRERLADPTVKLLDARSTGEYSGARRYAKRGGHIPGAINVDWQRNLRPDGTFKPVEALRAMYAGAGLTPDKTVVTYCQTNHRGAHGYFVLRLLGYPRVTGYDRSWAEWGDRDDLPIAR